MSIEYEVETTHGELVGVFNFSELREYFKTVKKDSLKKAYQRGDVLLGTYRIAKIEYDMEEDY